MRKALTTLTAATAALPIVVGLPSAAHAFVPLVAGALIAGGALAGGAVIGSANNGYYYAPPTVVAPAPTVAPACYLTHEMINGVWRRVEVCTNY